MIKVHILSRSSNSKYLRRTNFWSFFEIYKKELKNLGIDIIFFNKINDSFFKGDKLILNSKFFSVTSSERLSILKKIYKINDNLIWYDMRDSTGNTQFDVLPFVKFYLKKQFLKDKELYKKNFFNNRIYSEYYNKNFFQSNLNYQSSYSLPLDFKYIDKLVLGWNVGITRYFDFAKYGNFKFNLCKLDILNIEDYLLKNYKINFDKKNDINCEFGLHPKQNKINSNILYQRKLLIDNLKKNNRHGFYVKEKNKKDYYNKLKNCKLVLGAFGLGEICNREFEATLLGASFTTGNMNHLDTWPNIYRPDVTYLPLNWDMSNLNEVIERIICDKNLHNKLVMNSQKIINETFSDKGKKYFLSICKKIFF